MTKCPRLPAREGKEFGDLLAHYQAITVLYYSCALVHNQLVEAIKEYNDTTE